MIETLGVAILIGVALGEVMMFLVIWCVLGYLIVIKKGKIVYGD